jgi:hypothetical protein
MMQTYGDRQSSHECVLPRATACVPAAQSPYPARRTGGKRFVLRLNVTRRNRSFFCSSSK